MASYDPFGLYGGTSGSTTYKTNTAKKNAGKVYDPFSIGSVQAVANPDKKAPTQTARAVQPPQQAPQAKQSVSQKVKAVTKSLASGATVGEQKFAQGITRVLPGGTNDLKAEAQSAAADQANLQRATKLKQAGKINNAQYQKATKNIAGQANQSQQAVTKTTKSMPTTAQVALGAASTAADIITAGTFSRGKAALTAEKALVPLITGTTKKALGGRIATQLAGNATAGGLNAAAGGGNKSDIIKNAAYGAALPEVLHQGAHMVGNVASKLADKAGIGGKTAAKELARNTTTQRFLNYKPSNPKVQEIVKNREAQATADAAPAKAAAQQQASTAVVAEKTKAQGQKIDRQLEILQAKQKDTGTLSNVDKVKVQHLKEDKQNLTQSGDPFEAEMNKGKALVDQYDQVVAETDKLANRVTREHNINSAGSEPSSSETVMAKSMGHKLAAPDSEIDRIANPTAKPEHVVTVDDHDYALTDTAHTAYKTAEDAYNKKVALYSKPVTAKDPIIARDLKLQNAKGRKAAAMKFAAEKRRIVKNESGVSDYVSSDTAAGAAPKPTPESSPVAGQPQPKLQDTASAKPGEVSSAKDTPPEAAPVSEQKANTEPKLSNRKQTEYKPGGDEPTVVPVKEPTIKQPDIGQSRLAASTEQKAIDKKLTDGFEGKPEYAKVNVKEQAKAALELHKSDPERAVRIALGQEVPPGHLLPESVYIAVENHALKTKDVGLLRRLATESSVSSEATGMGQRIRMLGERNPDSAVTAMRRLSEARKAAVEKRLGKPAAKAVSDEVKQIRAAQPKVTVKTWSDFVDSIKC